jgi:hypothetical protein
MSKLDKVAVVTGGQGMAMLNRWPRRLLGIIHYASARPVDAVVSIAAGGKASRCVERIKATGLGPHRRRHQNLAASTSPSTTPVYEFSPIESFTEEQSTDIQH